MDDLYGDAMQLDQVCRFVQGQLPANLEGRQGVPLNHNYRRSFGGGGYQGDTSTRRST